jgi:hypothetical protein
MTYEVAQEDFVCFLNLRLVAAVVKVANQDGSVSARIHLAGHPEPIPLEMKPAAFDSLVKAWKDANGAPAPA